MAERFSTIGLIVGPLAAVAIIALISWLITAIAAVLGKTARFRDVFALTLCCTVIGSLQYIASYVVLAAKHERIDNPEQLRPPFGLDIFLPDLHGVPLAIVGYFSVFQIWYLVALTLGIAALTRSSKGQALAMVTPAWVLPLALTVLGAATQR